jgi:OOP family OmpA-OmpF porin
MDFSIEIDGYADAVGDEPRNIDLSQRRANRVRDFLTACGFDAAMLKPIGQGQPLKPAAGDKTLPDQAQRRVAFKILSQRSAVAR